MKSIISKLVLVVATLGVATGCYNNFDNPAPEKVWTAADFEGQIVSIGDFKQLFYDEYGSGSSSLAKTYYVNDDIVVTGRVISSDRSGNVYKSLYIYDEVSDEAIELRLHVSNYVYYHPGQRVFVKAKGLVIGSYRYMLSIGLPPSSYEVAEGYANSNLEDRVVIDKHIFKGDMEGLSASDTLVVNASNYKTALTDKALGRLVRFEDIESIHTTWDETPYPSYLEIQNIDGVDIYTDRNYEGEPTWAYSYDGDKFYGSSLFSFTNGAEIPYGQEATGGTYITRVSGYANFALRNVPANATTGDLTAIYTKYSSRSGGFIKYQLLMNSDSDVVGF